MEHTLTIAELLTPGVITVSPAMNAAEAVSMMSEKRISCLIAAEEGIPAGIITERDTVKYAMRGLNLATLSVGAVMTAPVVTSPSNIDIFEAYYLLSANRIRHIVVTNDDGSIAGVVTQSDIVRNLGLELGEIRRISRIMTTTLAAAAPAMPLDQAVKMMAEKGISCIVAEVEKKPVGILTERDVTRLVGQKTDFAAFTVGDVMTAPIITIDGNAPVNEVARLMKQKRIRRLVVVNDDGTTGGLVTQSDLIKGVMEGRYIETLREMIRRKETILGKTEKTLTQMTIFLDSILYSSRDMGIIATDPDLRIVHYNRAAETIFGYAAQHVRARRVLEAEELKRLPKSVIDKVLEEARGESGHLSVFELVGGGGKKIVEVKISAIRDHRRGDEVIGYLMNARDITRRRGEEAELRNAKLQAEEATRMKDQFVSLVAHDLKSPLSSMMGFIRLLQDDAALASNADSGRMLGMAYESGERMLTLINDLLGVSRLRSGALKPAMAFINGHTVAVHAAADLAPQAAEKNITIRNTVPPNIRLYADPALYREVVKNLISNAIKFSRPGGSVNIFVPEGEKTTLAVADNGVGIDRARIGRLFSSGENVSTIGTAMERGTGVGLPICFEVMQAMRGTIMVDSKESEGSIFHAQLPVVRPRILVADDDQSLVGLLSLFFDGQGADMIHAPSIAAAMKLIYTESPHLLITDTVLPDGEGFGLIEAVRRSKDLETIPVIVVASDHEMSTRDRVFELGANDFVTKPASPEDLLPRIKRFLG